MGFKDLELTAKIKGKLIDDLKLSEGTHIDVNVHNGIVSLSGNVPDQTVHDKAIEIAQSVKDVKQVEDHLNVK
jgi:osmotically-inducible protein OsmY